jgi:hypothetical protein
VTRLAVFSWLLTTAIVVCVLKWLRKNMSRPEAPEQQVYDWAFYEIIDEDFWGRNEA